VLIAFIVKRLTNKKEKGKRKKEKIYNYDKNKIIEA